MQYGFIKPFGCFGEEITIHFWLILLQSDDFGCIRSKSSLTNKKKRFRALSILVLFLYVLPLNVFAGFFDIFLPAQAQTPLGTIENVQTMRLLNPTHNPDSKSAVGGGGIDIIDGTVLTAVSNPLGDGESKSYESGQISVYVVKEGDSLSQIAKMFDVSPNTIAWANELGRDRVIQPGQKLIILPITGVSYTVEKGDTLRSIAKQFHGDENEIMEYNNIYDNEALAVGMNIVIPGGEQYTEELEEEDEKPYKAPKPVQKAPTYAGYYQRPLVGGVKTQGLHGYNAIDFGASVGTSILASASGNVIISKVGGWNGGYGNYVVIEHPNGTQTLYAHNSSNAVGVGQYVVQGQVIGYVGSTGRSTGAHVHFEVRGAKNPF